MTATCWQISVSMPLLWRGGLPVRESMQKYLIIWNCLVWLAPLYRRAADDLCGWSGIAGHRPGSSHRSGIRRHCRRASWWWCRGRVGVVCRIYMKRRQAETPRKAAHCATNPDGAARWAGGGQTCSQLAAGKNRSAAEPGKRLRQPAGRRMEGARRIGRGGYNQGWKEPALSGVACGLYLHISRFFAPNAKKLAEEPFFLTAGRYLWQYNDG